MNAIDRELIIVATALERLAARVESLFDAGAPGSDELAGLLQYAWKSMDVLNDREVMLRLTGSIRSDRYCMASEAFIAALSKICSVRGAPVSGEYSEPARLRRRLVIWDVSGSHHGLRIDESGTTVTAWGTTGVAHRVVITEKTGLLLDHLLMAATAVGLLEPDGGQPAG